MARTLLARMTSWLDLLEKRADLTVTRLIELGVPPLDRYPDDARAFGATRLHLSYRGPGGVDGFLYLELGGFEEPAYLLVDGVAVDPADMFIADADVDGVGLAAWYVLPAGGPVRIVWSVEDPVVFGSLTEYLTRGAQAAFSYAGQPWQRGGEASLAAISAPTATPLAEIEARLVQQGASLEVAQDLIEWLGGAAALLLPK